MGSTDSAPGSAAESGGSAGFRKMHDFDVQFSLGTLRAVREGQSNPGQLTRSPLLASTCHSTPHHPSRIAPDTFLPLLQTSERRGFPSNSISRNTHGEKS